MNQKKGNQVCIRLTRPERLLMLRRFALPDGLREQIQSESVRPVEVWMTADEADELREQAGELFQEVGIGPDEAPTADGRLLDELIDRLYHG